MIRKRRLHCNRYVPPLESEDDGNVMIRGHLVPPYWAEWNAQQHMDGFDELPKKLRDQINYADTPEEGARPTKELVKEHFDAKSRALSLIRSRMRLSAREREDLDDY